MKTLGAAALAAPVAAKGAVVSGPLASPPVASGFSRKAPQDAITPDALAPIAEVVLPSELGAEGRRNAVSAFVRWIRNYTEGADTDHGYGNTRIRSTGPSPARNYPSQLEALDAAARAQGAASFAAAGVDARRAILESALASAKIERLPGRPGGGHVAADLMGHFFNSSAGSDLCYRAAIGRDTCRGLPGSENRPAPLSRRP
jgi:hypothetical protein